MQPISEIQKAVRNFDLNGSHLEIFTDANELVTYGFPPEFLLPLYQIHESSTREVFVWKGEIRMQVVGILRHTLVWAIAKALNIDTNGASEFSGRGFQMQFVIDQIRKEFPLESAAE